MKERPILFSTEMVKAVLNGSKTQTRRLNGLEEINQDPDNWILVYKGLYWTSDKGKHENAVWVMFKHKDDLRNHVSVKCPYGFPGNPDNKLNEPADLLWVRETFLEHPYGGSVFKADSEDASNILSIKWKPSIFMPKPIARTWLELEEIRVERLQSISKADAIAEGVVKDCDYGNTGYRNYLKPDETVSDIDAVHSYETLWLSINGKDSWKHNPWVWVLKYKIISTTGKHLI